MIEVTELSIRHKNMLLSKKTLKLSTHTSITDSYKSLQKLKHYEITDKCIDLVKLFNIIKK